MTESAAMRCRIRVIGVSFGAGAGTGEGADGGGGGGGAGAVGGGAGAGAGIRLLEFVIERVCRTFWKRYGLFWKRLQNVEKSFRALDLLD